MVNTKEFTARLELVREYYALNATAFADAIGVPPSSISHILGGRNKPSLDFVTKIMLRYPEINAEWLLTGKGSMLGNEITNDRDIDIYAQNALEKDSKTPERLPDVQQEIPLSTQSGKKKEAGRLAIRSGSTAIEKIVFFYADGSFEEYTPKG